MLINSDIFAKKLNDNELSLAFIGMSNIGKTFWSNRFDKNIFEVVSIDKLIANSISTKFELPLFDEKSISEWMGMYYEDQYANNSEIYISLEAEHMDYAILKKTKKNKIVDTAGSVVHLSENIISKLKKNCLVIYLYGFDDKLVSSSYEKDPKPVYFPKKFLEKYKIKNEKNDIYLALFEKRKKLYQAIADISIDIKDLRNNNPCNDELLNFIMSKL